MTHFASIKSLFVSALIISLVVPPTLVFSQNVPPTPPPRPSSLDSSDNDDSDSDEESEEERDRREAENTAAEVFAAAEAAGVMLEVGVVEAVYGASPSGSEVTVGGVSLGKEEALAAISAMGSAKSVGALGVVSVEKTLAGYGRGDVCSGCVIGENTGVTGQPEQVAHAEADYIIGTANVVSVRNPSTFTQVPANDLSGALAKISTDSLQAGVLGLPSGSANFNTFGEVIVQQNPYQKYSSQQVNHAGRNRLTNTSFTYDPTTGNFIGGQNGAIVAPSSVPNSERVISLATESPTSVVSVDFKSGNGIIAAQDILTGWVSNYDSETGNPVSTNTIIDSSVSELLFSPRAISGEDGTRNTFTFVQQSPFQRALLGEQNLADFSDQFADILAGENSDIAGKIGRGENLTSNEMAEALMIIGAVINRTDNAAGGGEISDFLRPNIFSSLMINRDTGIPHYQMRIRELSNNQTYSHDNVTAFYTRAFSGQLAINTFLPEGSDLTPAPFASHFYSPSFYEQHGGSPGWSSSIIPGTEIRVGEHSFTNLYLSGSATQEYRLKTSGLPLNVTLIDVAQTPLTTETVAQFNAGVITLDQQNDEFSLQTIAGLAGRPVQTLALGYTLDTPTTYQSVVGAKLSNSDARSLLDERVVLKDNSVSLMGVRDVVVDHLNRVAEDCRCNITLTSVTDGRHAKGQHSHAEGYKFDARTWGNVNGQSELTAFITNPTNGWTVTSSWRDGTPVYTNPAHPGVSYAREARGTSNEHWDVQVRPSGSQTVGSTPRPTQTSVPTPNQTIEKIVEQTVNEFGSNIGEAIAGDLGNFVGGTFGTLLVNGLTNLFGGQLNTGTPGTWNFSPSSGSSEGSENEDYSHLCSQRNQLTPAYWQWLVDNGHCLDTQATSTNQVFLGDDGLENNNQQATVIMTNVGIAIFETIRDLFELFITASDTYSSIEESANIGEKTIVPVTITINSRDLTVEMSRDDIISNLENNTYQYSDTEFQELISRFEETPLVFSADGLVVYSNGLYSPEVKNGALVPTAQDYEYVYLLRYIDEDGNVTEVEDNVSSLPENMFTNLIGRVFTNRSPFNLEQVREVTYRLVDPDRNIPGDEYYDYVVTLAGGQQRGIIVPQYSSVQLMRERFSSIGYQGDVLILTGQAVERTEPSKGNLFNQMVSSVASILERFTDVPGSDDPNNGYADLPSLQSEPTASDIISVFIYPSATVHCPSGVAGYMYTAVLRDKNDSDFAYALTDGRCGHGSPEELLEETARHLSERHMVEGVTASNIADKTSFRVEPVLFTPSITKVPLRSTPVIVPEEPTDTELSTSTTPTTTEQLPNVTNEVVFEVKAVGSDGRLLSDWVATEKITITEGVQLYFRWDASKYQQCLPFLNDNGNYSLTRRNRAMVTGNTEAEQYNVTERSATYSIECGGQSNNEFGVDTRRIEVVVQ